jgi:hypothetical protein
VKVAAPRSNFVNRVFVRSSCRTATSMQNACCFCAVRDCRIHGQPSPGSCQTSLSRPLSLPMEMPPTPFQQCMRWPVVTMRHTPMATVFLPRPCPPTATSSTSRLQKKLVIFSLAGRRGQRKTLHLRTNEQNRVTERHDLDDSYGRVAWMVPGQIRVSGFKSLAFNAFNGRSNPTMAPVLDARKQAFVHSFFELLGTCLN